ncbi:MAG: hypothetical protein L0H59_11325 [Tomitella sp.]|nr:hypothetical protein [Tomitella sp.]
MTDTNTTNVSGFEWMRRLDQQGMARTVGPLVQTVDRDVVDSISGDFRRWLGTHRGMWASWQDAWNMWARTSRGATWLRYTPRRCPDCRGRRIDLRMGMVCRTCMGTNRPQPQSVLVQPAVPPAEKDG